MNVPFRLPRSRTRTRAPGSDREHLRALIGPHQQRDRGRLGDVVEADAHPERQAPLHDVARDVRHHDATGGADEPRRPRGDPPGRLSARVHADPAARGGFVVETAIDPALQAAAIFQLRAALSRSWRIWRRLLR